MGNRITPLLNLNLWSCSRCQNPSRRRSGACGIAVRTVRRPWLCVACIACIAGVTTFVLATPLMGSIVAIGLHPDDGECGGVQLCLEASALTVRAADFVAAVIGLDPGDVPAPRAGKGIELLERLPVGERHIAGIFGRRHTGTPCADCDKGYDCKAVEK